MSDRSRSGRSSRHSSSSSSSSSSRTTMTDQQINDLLSKLQALLPEVHHPRTNHRVSAAKVLQETCRYIRGLHREVEDLSERLSALLAVTDDDDVAQAAIIRSLLDH